MLVAYGCTSGRQILSSEVSLGVITAPNAELVAICLVIVQATSSNIIITDSLSAVKNDSTPQSGQCQSITIAKYLRIFFESNSKISIEFWDCPSEARCSLQAQAEEDDCFSRIWVHSHLLMY